MQDQFHRFGEVLLSVEACYLRIWGLELDIPGRRGGISHDTLPQPLLG